MKTHKFSHLEVPAYSPVLTTLPEATCCSTVKKLHESPLQLCVYVAKFLVEVIGDLDEIFACY